MTSLWQDLRFALRQLTRRPGFSVTAALTLAVGIGATTTIFSVVHSVLLEPLPFASPDRLVRVYGTKADQGVASAGISSPDARDMAARLESFEALGLYSYHGLTLSGSDRPQEITTLQVTPGLLRMLGVKPQLGRTFLDEEAVAGNDKVVVVGHDLWTAELGGEPEVVGRGVQIDGEEWTIVGILPPGFRFPDSDVSLYIPLTESSESRRAGRRLTALGLLRPGVGLQDAQTEVEAVAAGLAQEYPATNEGWSARLVPYLEVVVGDVRPALLVLLAAVALVLLIACANTANLLFSRSLGRRQEVAVRAALGAGRTRLIRLVLAEALLLALVGGGLGVLFAHWGVDLLVAAGPADLPRLEEVRVDSAVLGFSCLVTLLTAALVGLLPALRLARLDPNSALRGASRTATSNRQGQAVRRVLTVGEVALSLVLLIAAGLMVRSFAQLMATDPGYRIDDTLAVQLFVYGPRYEEPKQQVAFFDRLLAEARALPGVEAAGAVSALPLGQLGAGTLPVHVVGRSEAEPQQAGFRAATPTYFETLGIPVVRGRGIEEGDRDGALLVAVLNESAAKLYFPGSNPIGQRFRSGSDTELTFVGVVGDIRHDSLEAEPQPEIFFPFAQQTTGGMSLVVRTAGEPGALLEDVQRRVWQVDPEQPVFRAVTLGQLASEDTARRRLYTSLIGAFALVALGLATLGLYGVISYATSQRTREIGIRMTLGARSRDVLAMVLGQGAILVAVGLALGLAGGLALSRLLGSLLYGVTGGDLATFATVPLVLAAAALLACWVPARRAARLDPLAAMHDR